MLLRRIGQDPVLALNAKPQEHTVESEIHDSLLAERVSNGTNDLDHRKDPLRDDWFYLNVERLSPRVWIVLRQSSPPRKPSSRAIKAGHRAIIFLC